MPKLNIANMPFFYANFRYNVESLERFTSPEKDLNDPEMAEIVFQSLKVYISEAGIWLKNNLHVVYTTGIERNFFDKLENLVERCGIDPDIFHRFPLDKQENVM